MLRELPVAKPKVLLDPMDEYLNNLEEQRMAHGGYFAGRNRQRNQ
jgi:hypothetical protein